MYRFLLLACLIYLTGCASTDFRVMEINSLASERPGEGYFDGLESMAVQLPGQDARRVNILFLHGIGWVENPEDKPLANNFVRGVADAYGLDVDEKAVSSLCGRAPDDESELVRNHILITEAEPKLYRTAIPGRQLKLDRLVCMDKQVLSVSDDLEYVIYRIFWDEVMWQSLQFAHVGQDDALGDSSDFADLRRAFNRNLKDKFVNFGFSDAVMYLGPAGREIRDAIRGAMCAAALDSAGVNFAKLDYETDYETVCGTASEASIDVPRFAFVTESLGSKIGLDLMREAMTDDRETVHDDMIKRTKMFMLANQIPLLSLSDLSEDPAFEPSEYTAEDRPTFVAFSEINDFLTYELVPFYEQLYQNSVIDPEVDRTWMNEFDRRRLVELLGFNVIDMRVEFASPLIPLFSGFVDPEFAHNGHVQQPEVMQFILCGGVNDRPKLDGCEIQMAANRQSQ